MRGNDGISGDFDVTLVFMGTRLSSLPGGADDRAIGVDLLPKDAKLLSGGLHPVVR